MTLTLAALLALTTLKFGMWLADRLFPGTLGECIEAVATVTGLCLGTALSLLRPLPMSWGGSPPLDAVPTSTPARLARLLSKAVALLVLDAAALWMLPTVLPFGTGLVSCLYYCLPAVLLSCLTARHSKATLSIVGAILVVAAALAVPVRDLQAHIAAQQWLRDSGVPKRAQAQVVVLPGMPQEPYEIYQGTVIANFDTYLDGNPFWSAVETVTVGKPNPCGPMTVAEGDTDGTVSMSCKQVAADLWLRRDSDGGFGYVLERDGVTITLAGGSSATTTASLREEILAAHPASDAELWSREGSSDSSLLGLILL